MTEVIVIIALTVALNLAISWSCQKLGLDRYLAKAAKRAAQESILRD
jgi:hypothetical protein